ncbi:MAG: hypothetical protein AB8I08_10340 [Sandaracinaceae bacterium]
MRHAIALESAGARGRLSFLLFSCLLAACVETPASVNGINSVVGDLSWVEAHGERPSADVPDQERIVTHLSWVERHLRAASTTEFSAGQRTRRAALLDELGAYRNRGMFPRNEGLGRGRTPRFVDDAGRHCAVAHLAAYSGDRELVATVQARHEHDLVRDMESPALAEWANEHGMRVSELALIQPSYDDGSDVGVPSRFEEERARRRARAAAGVPRPLTAARVRTSAQSVTAWPVVQECMGERTGHWHVEAELSVGRGFAVRSRVHLRPEGGGERDRSLERCFERALVAGMQQFIRSANHRLGRPIHETIETRLDVASLAEVRHALLQQQRTWSGSGSRRSALAACFEALPAEEGLRVPISVSSSNGRVGLRLPALESESPGMTRPERRRLHCVQSVLGYGDLPARGTRDYALDVLVMPDGSLRDAAGSEP